jgi:CRISPR system Cascade subunit CasA
VREQSGALTLIALRTLLLQPRRLAAVEVAAPVELIAIHRLVLAILHRALRGPEDILAAVDWFRSGFPERPIEEYLHRIAHRFDLFDDAAPFYQVASFQTKHAPVSRLAFDLASGTNKLLFDHTLDSSPPALTPAEAARALIARQMLAVPEGAGYSPSPVGGAALVIVQGQDLHETLCLNLPVYSEAEQAIDAPIWEEPQLVARDLAKKPKPDSGRTRRYTWISRFIRLEPETTSDGVRVRWVNYAAGFKPEVPGVLQQDPMVALQSGKDGGIRQLRFREGRTLWRDAHSLLPPGRLKGEAMMEPPVVRHAANLLTRCNRGAQRMLTLVAGASNDKAKILLWRQEHMRLPAAVEADRGLREEVEDAISRADLVEECLRRALFVLAARLLVRGERKADPSAANSLVRHLGGTASYWSSLAPAFEEQVLRLDGNVDKIMDGWRISLFDAARRCWRENVLAAGSEARALRAAVPAELMFERGLRALEREWT